MPAKVKVYPLDESVGFLMSHANRELAAGLGRSFRGHGWAITPEQWAVLNRLWQEDGIHQSELAQRVFKDRHNITRILHLLEKHGFVTRRPHPQDARRLLIFLTPAGRRAKETLVPIVEEYLARALSGLSRAEVDSLKKSLKKIMENLNSAGASGPGPQGE